MNTSAPGKSFYIIGTIALLWNLAGVASYIMQVTMSPEAIAALPQAQQDLMAQTPAWATGAYAVAVHGGLIGSILLLMKRYWALWAFGASLLGVVVQMGHAFLMTDALTSLGPSVAILPSLIFVICIALVWYTIHAKSKTWLS